MVTSPRVRHCNGLPLGKMNQNADILCRASLNHTAVSVSKKTQVQGGTRKDEHCQRVRGTLEKKGSRSSYIVRDDGLLGTSVGRDLDPLRLRLNVICRLHDYKLVAHLGQAKVSASLRHRFFWPGMLDEAKQLVRNCIRCHKRKTHRRNIAPGQPCQKSYVWKSMSLDRWNKIRKSVHLNEVVIFLPILLYIFLTALSLSVLKLSFTPSISSLT